MSRLKVIVNADPDDYGLVGRVVRRVTSPDYVWPEDGITSVSFSAYGQEDWQGRIFSVRRNKSSITVYGPEKEASNV